MDADSNGANSGGRPRSCTHDYVILAASPSVAPTDLR